MKAGKNVCIGTELKEGVFGHILFMFMFQNVIHFS